MQGVSSIPILPGLAIPAEEIAFTASRASGPGGQHVNVTESRVTLWFDLEASPSLDEAQKARIRERLAGRIGKDGRLRVTVQSERSQHQNRAAALDLFAALLAAALAPRKKRRPTKPTKASQERRLDAKRRRSALKRERAGGGD
ncbi:MAG: alternative ribosome rescue aminoacyl-tRNA hydrolase ArfB [Thermodesulfobacteriota bacterium]